MKYALISLQENACKVVGWRSGDEIPEPVIEAISNAARVAEVAESTFPVADTLFWVECADNVIADEWYYDIVGQQILAVPAAPPMPASGNQPSSTGSQTL